MSDLDELRRYAEAVSQKTGAATVIVALGDQPPREYVIVPHMLALYKDPVVGALVESIRYRTASEGYRDQGVVAAHDGAGERGSGGAEVEGPQDGLPPLRHRQPPADGEEPAVPGRGAADG